MTASVLTAAPVTTPASAQVATSGPADIPLTAISSAAIAASPALTRIASKGAQLYALGVSHGMQGVFARHGQYFQVFYITPDGKAAIAGIMWNAHGRNVTLREVRHIPGLVPTVKIGSANPHAVARHVAYRVPAAGNPLPAATTMAASREAGPGALPAGSLFEALATSNHGTIGKPGAPRVWMMMDPLCSYSIAAMRQLMPVIAAGQLRVSVVPLAILDYEDHGMSTPEAKIMLSQPPKLMAADWIDKGLAGETADATAGPKLAFNMSIARAVYLKGTPTFFWRTKAGSIGRSNGLPPDVPAWIASIRKPS
jgi:thiol:disulfide interchange protein DsbG